MLFRGFKGVVVMELLCLLTWAPTVLIARIAPEASAQQSEVVARWTQKSKELVLSELKKLAQKYHSNPDQFVQRIVALAEKESLFWRTPQALPAGKTGAQDDRLKSDWPYKRTRLAAVVTNGCDAATAYKMEQVVEEVARKVGISPRRVELCLDSNKKGADVKVVPRAWGGIFFKNHHRFIQIRVNPQFYKEHEWFGVVSHEFGHVLGGYTCGKAYALLCQLVDMPVDGTIHSELRSLTQAAEHQADILGTLTPGAAPAVQAWLERAIKEKHHEPDANESHHPPFEKRLAFVHQIQRETK